MRDYNSGINNAMRMGAQKNRVEMVRSFRAAGVSLNIIQACTGLSFDEIERICNS
jgi:hypothetical protein